MIMIILHQISYHDGERILQSHSYDGFLVKHSGPGLGMDVVFSEHSGSGGQVWVSVMRLMAGWQGGGYHYTWAE